MLAKLSRRDRLALTVGAIATALFLVVRFGVFPLLDRLPGRDRAVEEKRLALLQDQRLVASAGLEQAKLAQAEERLKVLEVGLLESPSASLVNAEWQRLVRELADSKGIELISSEVVRVESASPDYDMVVGRTQFRCRLEQLVDFLAGLATSPKLLSATRLRVTGLQGDPKQHLNVELTVGTAVRAKGIGGSPTAPQR